MSLMPQIEEFSLNQLKAEVKEREKRKEAGVCTHCARDYWSSPTCKFPLRHRGKEF